MNWNSVTLSQFMQLQEIVKIEDETDRMLSLMELLFGEDVVNLPVTEFNKKTKELEFLQTPVPTNHIVKSVTINGHKYKIDAVLGHISTAQYVDFTNFSKQENATDKMLAVFFIPEGHKYNCDYDLNEVINDMGDLPIDIAMSECFFFSRQLVKFTEIFQRYLYKTLKKSKMNKQVKTEILKQVQIVADYVNSVSYPS